MQNVSNRQRRAQSKMASGPETAEYVILDPSHRVDLRGEFAGVKVVVKNGHQTVRLTESAARFYLDSGSIAPLAS